MAFKNEIASEFKSHHCVNIISVGDADYEYNALISLDTWNHKSSKILKSIRFMKDPSHDTLVDQLEVLINAIPEITHRKTHLDLKFDQHLKNK